MSATWESCGEAAGHRPGRVVVGVSRSVAGLQALRYAAAEARRRGAPLMAVRAFRFQPPWWGPELVQFRDELRAEARVYAREAIALAVGGLPIDLDVCVAVREDRTDRALIDLADAPDDLLVLGRRGGPIRFDWLVRACLRRAICPVVVVPPPALARVAGRRMMRRLLREIADQPHPPGPTAIGWP